MKLRASLLAGIVVPLIGPLTAAPTFAGEAAPPLAGVILAQADQPCVEGQDCPPAEAQQGETRQERRARLRRERQQQEAAPAQESPPERGEPAQQAAPELTDEQRQQRRERRERARAERERQQQNAAPAGASEPAAPAQDQAAPELTDEQRQQRRERRERARAERERQQQNATPAAPAEPAAPAQDQAAPELTEEQLQRRRERRERARAERERQQQNAAPAEPAAPAQDQVAPELTEEQLQQRRERRERARAERERQQQEAAPTAPAQGQAAPQLTAEELQQRRERRERRRAQRERQERLAAEQNKAAAQQPAPDVNVNVNVEQSATERQLQAQGDRAEADRVRRLRQKLRAMRRDERREDRQELREDRRERVEDRQELREDRAERVEDRRERRGRVLQRRGDRVVVDLGGGRIVVRSEYDDESERLLYGARDVEVIEQPNGRTRTVIYREDGSQVITVRNRYGDIVRRFRRYPDNREVVLIENIYLEQEDAPLVYQPIELPPLRVSVPQEEYIVEYAEATPQQIQEVLVAPPVEQVERAYSVQEVTTNVRVRDKMSRIDLDAITFEFGSATIGPDQMDALDELGFAMEEVIKANPEEVYLIEGHTDAVGSDEDNLLLSDSRAEAVAVALSQNFEIPAENLVTEGYGEQYLKVPTEGPERENRRVTVRRITPLLAAEAQQ